MNDSTRDPQHGPGLSRRRLIQGSLAGSAAAVLLGGPPAGAFAAAGPAGLSPLYYPKDGFTGDVDIAGNLAVVTGASRGNGRAIAEALATANVDVIGTSRNPAHVTAALGYPLVTLDVADPLSVATFPARLAATPLARKHGGVVNILANNAGRFVLGEIVPRADTPLAFYLAQRELGVRTLYTGHVMLTNVMLPLMPKAGYSRIIFTVSVASYYTGAVRPALPDVDTRVAGRAMDTYSSCKAALRVYAANLGTALSATTSIQVSTVNPYVMNTALAEHPNPIYTQPVGPNGLSGTDGEFNAVVTALRSLLLQGQPASRVGETYIQLLRTSTPPRDVVVGSPVGTLATQGANLLIEGQVLAENATSAMSLISA